MTARPIAMALLVALSIGSCTSATHATSRTVPSTPTFGGDPTARLERLGRAWFRTSATVTFDTQTHEAGEPASGHQCLRQTIFGDNLDPIDRATAIRLCSKQGVVRFTWDPPDRWRMDVTTPNEAYAVISAPGGSYRCDGSGEGIANCVVRTSRQAERATAFRSMLATPKEVLDGIGADVQGAVTRALDRPIAGSNAECFWATGVSGQEAGWCFSQNVLVFFTITTADGTSARLEATHVSASVARTDLTHSS